MRRVVLAGCGHAHLEVVRRAAAFRRRGAELVLIDPGRFWYSGRAGGLLGGRFTTLEASLDPAPLAAANGVRLVVDTVAGLDRPAREVVLASGARIAYDLVSFNIGSRVDRPVGFEGASAVTPISALADLGQALAATTGDCKVLVVGGGASACEIAGNLLHLASRRAPGLKVTLAAAGPRLVDRAPAGLARRAADSLACRGATIRLGARVEAVANGSATLSCGEAIAVDRLVLATGLLPGAVVAALGLPLRSGGLRIGADLASIADASVFAAGDCAALEGHDLAKAGVYGVRAGPVLAANLLARLEGRPLEAFRPQRRYLAILDLADGEGLAMRGGFWMGGRAMLAWKNRLDTRFLERYRMPP